MNDNISSKGDRMRKSYGLQKIIDDIENDSISKERQSNSLDEMKFIIQQQHNNEYIKKYNKINNSNEME